MAEMAVSREAKAPFFRAWSPGFSTQTIGSAAFMSVDFFGAREQEKCRAPFSGEDFVDATRRGRARPDATNLRTCGRHKNAAQTVTLPWLDPPVPRSVLLRVLLPQRNDAFVLFRPNVTEMPCARSWGVMRRKSLPKAWIAECIRALNAPTRPRTTELSASLRAHTERPSAKNAAQPYLLSWSRFPLDDGIIGILNAR